MKNPARNLTSRRGRCSFLHIFLRFFADFRCYSPIFAIFANFLRINWRFFLKTNVIRIQIWQKYANIFAIFFCRKIFLSHNIGTRSFTHVLEKGKKELNSIPASASSVGTKKKETMVNKLQPAFYARVKMVAKAASEQGGQMCS
jgi:hypothetical protein